MANKFKAITETATKVASNWSNRDIARFHYFNPNGLISTKRVTDQKINALVESGRAKSGSIIAHGSLNYFYYDVLAKMIDKKSVSRVDLIVALNGLRRDIEQAEQFIQSV